MNLRQYQTHTQQETISQWFRQRWNYYGHGKNMAHRQLVGEY